MAAEANERAKQAEAGKKQDGTSGERLAGDEAEGCEERDKAEDWHAEKGELAWPINPRGNSSDDEITAEKEPG